MNHLTRRPGTLAAFVLLVVSASSPVRAGWEWLYPTPQGHDLYDVEFLTNSTAIAVGDAGTIMVSHDAGLSWSATNKVNGVTTALYKIARIDDTTAIVVGRYGVILKTSDAGETWRNRSSGTTLHLTDVDFAGQSGMAVAETRVFRSTDGGDAWEVIPWSIDLDDNGSYGGVDVISAALAFVTQAFVVWRTTDGGLNFDWVMSCCAQNLGEISFSDANTGVVMDGADLYVTEDGGTTWAMKRVEPAQSETGIAVTDIELLPSQDIIVSTGAAICDVYSGYRCSSYGEAQATTVIAADWDWDRQWTNTPLDGVAANSSGLRLFVGEGGAVHRWSPPADIEQTAGNEAAGLADGGAFTLAGNGSGIALQYEASYFWVGYEYTRLLLTSNGGASWAPTGSYAFVMRDVMFAPGTGTQPAYGVGQERTTANGLIKKTTDGGATWTTLSTGATFPAQNAVDFASPTRAVSVGEGGSVVVIYNDTVTPSTGPAPAASLRDVAFVSPLDGLAVGFAGRVSARVSIIIRTGDGGDAWESISNASTSVLYGVDFATPGVAVAVGAGGTVLRSIDSGTTWAQLSVSTTVDLFAVRFLSDTHGFICGSGGLVLETRDGGQSWLPLDSPATHSLTDIEPFGAGGVCFGGPGVNLLAYDQQPVPTLVSRFEAFASDFGVSLSWEIEDTSELDRFRIVRRNLVSASDLATYDVPGDRRAYRDDRVAPGTSYEYRLFVMDRDGSEIVSAPVTVSVPAAQLALLPNVPNPFNPTTTLRFVVPSREHVTLAIYDVAGRRVATLVDEVRKPGMNEAEWNGTDANGNPVASGVYVGRLTVGTKSAARTLVLLK